MKSILIVSCLARWDEGLNSIPVFSAAAVNIAKLLFGAEPVTSCPEGKSGYGKRENDCDHYNEPKFLEESEVAEQEQKTPANRSNCSAQDADAHLSVGLSHFLVSSSLSWMHIISSKMDNIINRETNQSDNSNGLCHSQLPADHIHDRQNTQNNYTHRENSIETLDQISCSNKQN